MEKLVREKLLPLLDKFEEERAEKIKSKVRPDTGNRPRVWSVNDVLVYEKYKVYSKEYGFIKRLVDNDKIETNNLSLKAFKDIFSGGGFVKVSTYEVLLMLLAISDTPIEDLISYLK